MTKTIAVIGGGAAGLMAAITAAHAGADVLLIEAAGQLGTSIRATGNGRCNLSNADIMSSDYNRASFVQAAMDELPPEEVQLRFSDMGLLAFEEEEGRIYPYSNQAATVVDLLTMTAAEAGVRVQTAVRVTAVRPNMQGGWQVELEDGGFGLFDSVIMACGGAPAKGLVPEDIPFVKTRPVLAPLRTDTQLIAGLSGTRVRARLYTDTEAEDLKDAWLDIQDEPDGTEYSGPIEQGEVLFRDYGISGIAAFDMSRYVKPGDTVYIDFLPDLEPQDKVNLIYSMAMDHPDRTAAQVLSGMLPANVARAIVVASGLNPDEPIIAEQEATVLAMVSESFGLKVLGTEGKQAQVTRGGYDVRAFNPATMECRAHPGLYVTGEMLDIDGRCGGYNLHWAWTSGALAGQAAAAQ